MKALSRSMLVGLLLAFVSGAGYEPLEPIDAGKQTSDVALRIFAASADKQPGYDPIEMEGSAGTTERYWIGDIVMSITPNQVQKIVLEPGDSKSGRITVYLDSETGSEYRTVSRQAVGEHLAFSLGDEVFMIPKVLEPAKGNTIILFNVPGRLLARFAEEVWSSIGE